MVLSLQAIDFLFASSIQDGCPLPDMDCSTDDCVGDDEGDEDALFFRSHFSSRFLSGSLAGLDSGNKIPNLCHIAAHVDTEYSASAIMTVMHVKHTSRFDPLFSLCLCVCAQRCCFG